MDHTCDKQPRIGEVYYMKFDGCGSEQRGWRPGLVFQNNVGNKYSPNIIALPFTTAMKKLDQPTHVLVRADQTGIPMDSIILCENPERVSKNKIGRYITTLPSEYLKKVAIASILATSIIACLEPEVLLAVHEKAMELNTEMRGI